jgi:hypothetical protein
MEVPQKTKNRTTTYDPTILLLGIYPNIPKGMCTTCTPMYTIHNSQTLEKDYMPHN